MLFQQTQDTTKQDTTQQYRPRRTPIFEPQDRYGDPFSNRITQTPFLLRNPSSLSLDVEIDTSMNYTIYERIGDLNYRPTTSMTYEEFMEYQDRQILREYWKDKSAALDGESAVSGRNLIPPIYVSPVFDRIFGGSYVEIVPRGFVTLDFGASWQRMDNPNISTRMQRSGGFEFDEQISMNVVGKVGEKLAITANYDNNSSFDFENNLKVDYTGFKEDILKKLEIGNVSLPLNNSLINGGQNLFGVKAQMQFGDLYVTALASTQRGKTETIEIEGGGSQGRPFEIIASRYDDNRHFFLGHFFRNNYQNWLAGLPFVSSGINVTRIEVYVVNRNNDTQTLRNVVGLMDLAESEVLHNNVIENTEGFTKPNYPNANAANILYEAVKGVESRNADQIITTLESLSYGGQPLNLENGTDFEKISGARKLSENEYVLNRELGYISLFRKLQNDEALAIAYEYTYRGQQYKVGELSEDYSGFDEDKAIFLKLLRQRKIPVDRQGDALPTWELMMKNIYNLSASNVSEEGFQLRVIYRDDNTGIDNPQLQEGVRARNFQLIELMGLDQLNQNEDRQRDGNFDFIPGITIIPETGLIIFPVLKPFEDPLREVFENDPNEDILESKYVYNELYDLTQIDAQQVAVKDKYFIIGSFQSGASNEINLPAISISEGSVKVFAGGVPLVEGRDYQVNYNFGKITILNQGILSSGKTISVTYEKADMFNFNTRSLVGTRLDYQVDEDINLGATLLHLSERRLSTRNSLGNEPTKNTKYGFDLNIRKDSRVLTKALDFLPFLSTKEKSTISFSGEFAQLIPGTSSIVDGEGTSYIDDFEAAATPFSLMNPFSWYFAATPETPDDRFVAPAPAGEGYRRAKIAWYEIDPIFYSSTNADKPDNIPDEITNHYVRPISPQEIFPNQDRQILNINERIFDIAYYPEERGIYNFNPDFESLDARKNWGGITNAITNEVDFDEANIEYLEFWLMDPFIDSENGEIDDGRNNPTPNQTGGKLIFNLGTISEDIMKDGRHAFENGLPEDGNYAEGENVVKNDWGYVTTEQFLVDAFDNSASARANQDVGLDGAPDEIEKSLFPALNNLDDPAADNFQYFLGGELDNENAGILRRYKNFNGLDGNSPISTDGNFARSSTTRPDNEDINEDNTLNEVEEYYEYSLNLRPSTVKVGQEYIVDKMTQSDIHGDEVTWYLVRIPVRDGKKFGNINGFKSIRYVRTYLTDFAEPVVLRFANFRFVSSKWRRYEKPLEQSGVIELPEPDNFQNFTVSVVSVEKNGQGDGVTQSPYVLPPGFVRDRDNTSVNERQLNEQSLQLCVDELEDGDARAVFRNFNPSLDMINFGRIKMFVHANSLDAEDDELTAFLRLGSDVDSNYYEIEIPLKISDPQLSSPEAVWPQENEIDLAFQELFALKSERDRLNIRKSQIYPLNGPEIVGRHRLRLKGNPNISEVTWITLGVRNTRSVDGRSLSACVWTNELRVTDFDKTAGWAANATLNAKLADFATITASARHSTFGFGGIQERISQRDRSVRSSYDIAANVAVDKLLPEEAGLQIPMFVSYEKNIEEPRFDPANPDIELDATLQSLEEQEDRDTYRQVVIDESTRRSINFINVKKVKTNPDAKDHFYDISNLAFSYSYNDMRRSNFNLAGVYRQNITGSVAYNYSPQSEPWQPFSKWESLKSPYLKLIKDFNLNLSPSSISIRGDLNRQFQRTTYRNIGNTSSEPVYEKFFNFNRLYALRWNLTRSLSLDYDASAMAIVDEPEGAINEEAQDSIWTNLKHLGRTKDFVQNIAANYRLPFDKLPVTDWISADLRYQASYRWNAGPAGVNNQPDSLDFGNTIQNSRSQTISGKIDLVKLYNKSKFLQTINRPQRNTRSTRSRPTAQKVDEEEPKETSSSVKTFFRFLMMVRSINANYSIREATILPGFSRNPYILGLDSGFMAPGIPFLLGSQDPGIKNSATNPDDLWLIQNENLTTPFSQDRTEDLTLRANIEPFEDFKLQLDAKKSTVSGYREIFRYEADSVSASNTSGFISENPNRGGSFTVSYIMIGTAFKGNPDNNSPIFEDFERNISIIRNRLSEANGFIGTYDTAQDVLIPAFVAAYSGRDVNNTSLSPFPKIPLPNWRIDYNGLSKIGIFKDKVQSITLSHSYKSTYTVGNYTSSLQYQKFIGLDTELENYNNTYYPFVLDPEQNRIVPIFIVNQVVLTEQFAPLIGIDIRTKDRLGIKIDYGTQRDVGLNISNSQVTEVSSEDISLEVNYTKKGFKLPFKNQGRVITLKNDLTFRMSFTIRNTKTIQRKINEDDKPTNGNYNFQLRPNINYVVNDKINLNFYFERNVNEPVVSTSYKRSTTQAGIQLRFSLAQ
ncbi:MAG: cell surface protein SprA [Candidatus Cyclobacteriaceae bacterium M2_1C_046]